MSHHNQIPASGLRPQESGGRFAPLWALTRELIVRSFMGQSLTADDETECAVHIWRLGMDVCIWKVADFEARRKCPTLERFFLKIPKMKRNFTFNWVLNNAILFHKIRQFLTKSIEPHITYKYIPHIINMIFMITWLKTFHKCKTN